MLITTTPNIEGKRIKEYLGIVTGEAVVGANLFRDLFAGLRDIVGGRSGAYEKELRKANVLRFVVTKQPVRYIVVTRIIDCNVKYLEITLDSHHICNRYNRAVTIHYGVSRSECIRAHPAV
jgi:hypothetical protein